MNHQQGETHATTHIRTRNNAHAHTHIHRHDVFSQMYHLQNSLVGYWLTWGHKIMYFTPKPSGCNASYSITHR